MGKGERLSNETQAGDLSRRQKENRSSGSSHRNSTFYFLPSRRMREVKARPSKALKVRNWGESMSLLTT